LIWWLWGSADPLPWVYDEAAYLLQAKIFAGGQWAAPGRPLPEFFEQVHVFVTPKLVPKYPPGHGLLLVPGVWLGLPALMPLGFTAVTGGLVFGLARGLAGPWVGGLTWMIWMTAPEELYLRPSFMSQTSTTLIWLVAWWLLARWRSQGRGRLLVGVAALAAVGVITRPITAVAFLIPVAVVVTREVWRRGAWVQLAAGIAAAFPILGIAAWWSLATSGKVYPTPYSEYSRVYVPWNMPGFRVDTTPPRRQPIPAIEKFEREWLPIHQRHTVERLPEIALERLGGIGVTMWGGGWRWILLGAAVIGLIGVPRDVRLVLWCGVGLFLAQLSLASRPLWTIYYLELFPALALVTALGAWRIAGWLGERAGRRWLPGLLITAAVLAAAPGTADRLVRAREQQVNARLVQADLARAIDSIPGKAMVFVAPGPTHRPHESYVENQPDLESTRVWVVHDRGRDNQRLMALAPDRTPYRFDPANGTIERLGSHP
jgi:hypothetical protein